MTGSMPLGILCLYTSLRKIPSLKQRIAGRSLPIEKFAINKAERYLQGEAIPLCGLVRDIDQSDVVTRLYRNWLLVLIVPRCHLVCMVFHWWKNCSVYH